MARCGRAPDCPPEGCWADDCCVTRPTPEDREGVESCPTCGAAVEVVGSDEGTQYYRPMVRSVTRMLAATDPERTAERIFGLEAEVRLLVAKVKQLHGELDHAIEARENEVADLRDCLSATRGALDVARDEERQAQAEVARLRHGLLACATAAGEDVSYGIPTWPDIVEWAVAAVREGREASEQDAQAAEDEADRLREAVAEALELNLQMWSEDEDNDSPGNMQHAILVAALEAGAAQQQIEGTEGETR